MARTLAAAAYEQPASTSLDALPPGSPEEIAAIRYRPDQLIWAADNLSFAIEPVHRSRSFPGEVELYLVEGETASRLPYEQDKFDFGKLKAPAPPANLGFSGLRVLRREPGGRLRVVVNVLNASILAGIARNQVWGSISRPLTVRAADQVSEEPLRIRTVWVERPNPAATALVIHTLIDTPSLACAVRFTLRADDAAVIDAEYTVFARVRVEHFGIAPILATYLLGAMDWTRSTDVRPATYEASGVQILTGKNEWLWRPVANRERLQFSAFIDRDPQGFGLVQRDRSFPAFLDDENEWQRRPSVWIEPIGAWGPGEVTVMEIPAASQNNKNIICYWRPKPGLAAGSEMSFAYRQFWSWGPPSRPDGAVVTLSRIGRLGGDSGDARFRILVQFEGDPLSDAAQVGDIAPDLWASAGKILAVKTYRTPAQSSVRVVLDVDTAGQSLIELRLLLRKGDLPKSETWLYRWTQ